ncbi:putative SERF-like protein [Rhopalosiphum maidis]|uniref:putative SERF-like protein n=1 Tax=Rhopalosiphum maidis TaxID=43146 RepID=UPI000EFFD2D4|nr:putative SERF-like protein [Rhopalosiphum maidis]XP_026810448.1 putative SERF-like protein [Rhopalosiphum maidis]
MARGNARDLAREKNQKKQQEQAKKKGISDKGSNQGLTLEQRKQRDADRMREKQLKKQEDKS